MLVRTDWQNVWSESMSRVNCEYLSSILDVIKSFCATNRSALDEIVGNEDLFVNTKWSKDAPTQSEEKFGEQKLDSLSTNSQTIPSTIISPVEQSSTSNPSGIMASAVPPPPPPPPLPSLRPLPTLARKKPTGNVKTLTDSIHEKKDEHEISFTESDAYINEENT